MKKQQPIIAALVALFLSSAAYGQNVGIGVATPTAKLHVNQPAAVNGVLIEHDGTNGVGLLVQSNNAANPAAVVGILNQTSGPSLVSVNNGLERGVEVLQNNTGASEAGIFVQQRGTGLVSRGVDVIMAPNTVAIGASVFTQGTGVGMYIGSLNASSTSNSLDIRNGSDGNGLYIENNLATGTAMGSLIFQDGIGRGAAVQISNATSNAIAVGAYHAGLGLTHEVQALNANNTAIAQSIIHNGLGRGNNISLTNSANAEVGQAIFQSGVSGMGQYIEVTDPLADQNSMGLFVTYSGTGTSAGGGGNAVEIQHYGNNGNAVDVFMGNPGVAPGPANSTSEYSALSVVHMATGTSPAGRNKSAIAARNNSADPTVTVNNTGTDNGEGINVFTNPSTATGALSAATYSQAQVGTNGFGVGVWGQGGNYGVIGSTGASGTNVGIFSNTNFQAVGTKAFVIDYPLDPANKKLRHFCIESDEVLNLYRGMVTLDANGQATVALPEYFETINRDFSYQLTAIGTGVQPYVATEIENNQFTVAGAPNTKVSWTVYAERNDPTVQYFERMQGADYRSPVTAKKDGEQGRYLTPEAYGKDRSEGIFYNPAHEQLAREARDGAKHQRAATPLQQAPKKSSNGVSSLRVQDVATPSETSKAARNLE